jgi:tellurium resistance protein TerD
MVDSDDHMIYFKQPVGPNSCVLHSGDNRTGISNGDNEVITVDFDKVSSSCTDSDSVMIFVTIFEPDAIGNPISETKATQNFSMLNNAYINIYDEITNELILGYELSSSFKGCTALHVGNFRKNEWGTWNFEIVGVGFNLNILSISKHLKVPSFR